MRVVEPSITVISPATYDDGVRSLRAIELYGRVSHRSEIKQTEDSWDRFIRAVVIGHGDWSIVEHAQATVEMVVDRGMSHELVRHRIASYTQESTRFVNYKNGCTFIMPELDAEQELVWTDAMQKAESAYMTLLHTGCTPQIARTVLPNALATKLVITANYRNWRHVLLMRTTKETHPQVRNICGALLLQFQALVPLLFDDIKIGDRQAAVVKD